MLTKSQTDFYSENGYLIVEDFLSPGEVENLRNQFLSSLEKPTKHTINKSNKRGFYSGILDQRINLWKDFKEIENFTFNTRLAFMASQLMNNQSVRLFQDHLLIKKAKDSKATPWHQDYSYFPMNKPEAITAWIALNDVNSENGCLCYLPASHTMGKISKVNFYNHQEPIENSNLNPISAELKAGSIVWHHCLTLHYAFPNISSRNRMAFAIIYMPDDTTFDGTRNPVTAGENLKVNEKITGNNFPILYKNEVSL